MTDPILPDPIDAKPPAAKPRTIKFIPLKFKIGLFIFVALAMFIWIGLAN